ncbi:DsbC family protein [Niveibacterium terrae]|uniref:DsbC family protein n=1 Tax=Niveibacterium terrae TaxID=3373598 RepID=UPI003A8F3077
MKQTLAAALAALLIPCAFANEADIRKSVSEFVGPNSIQAIAKTPYGGLYEVQLKSGEIVYTDDKASFLIDGQIIDVKRKLNFTAERAKILDRINFADLPLANAIKTVRGNGKRVIASFEDPNCGYCKRFAKELQSLKNTTIYTFLYPILTPNSAEKSKDIWCAKDRSKAWNDWMLEGKVAASANCKNPVEQNLALGHKLRITGTPTIYLADGTKIAGMLGGEQLEKAIDNAEKAAKK